MTDVIVGRIRDTVACADAGYRRRLRHMANSSAKLLRQCHEHDHRTGINTKGGNHILSPNSSTCVVSLQNKTDLET